MHVVVTGASSGIGAAIAREYARAGAKLTLVARRRPLLEELASSTSAQCHIVVHDLSEPDSAASWVPASEAALGPIEVLVNNAGIELTGAAASATMEDATRLLHLNLHAPIRITHAVLPGMLARRAGTIVDIASVSALVSPPRMALYSASKAGHAAFSEALRAELAGSGVHVVTVYPGPVKTALADSAFAAFGGRKGIVGMLPEGCADVLAARVRRAVRRRADRVIYPRFYALTRWFPIIARLSVDFAAPPLPPHDA